MLINVKAAGQGGNNKHLSEASSIKEAMELSMKHGIKYDSMKFKSTSYALWGYDQNGNPVKIANDYTNSGLDFIPGFSIAVDPHQIQYGSILYIQNYGWGMACDKGDAITWGMIDISFRWSDHSDLWGIKHGLKVINFGKHSFSADQVNNFIKIKKKYIEDISKQLLEAKKKKARNNS
jgi:3D (Asp-Asp-Asp) domain-containing protein